MTNILRSLLSLSAVVGFLQGTEPPPPWEQASKPGYFLKANNFIANKTIPPPPARNSLAEQVDLQTVLMTQNYRTPEMVEWAKTVDTDSVWKAGNLLGEWFTAANLPKTGHFFWQISVDSHAISEKVKKQYRRPRPPKLNPKIQPCVPLPTNPSYPSGHSLQAFIRAEILGDLVPARREELLQRAHKAAWARIIGGVHYPSDALGGQLLAKAFVTQLRQKPSYHRALEVCREEMAPYLKPNP